MTGETNKYTNEQLAETFQRIADLLEIKGENIYKILAYRKAADSLANLGINAYELWRKDELKGIPGIGKAITEKIDELFTTGRLGFLERLREEVPESLVDMLGVPDLGPKKAALFWKQLGITTLPELEVAAREGKLRSLPGMGEKSEAKVLAGIEALSRRSGRMSLGKAWPAAQALLDFLRRVPGVQAAEPAGSLRRMRSTIGDLDLLVASSDPGPVMEAFVNHPDVLRVTGHGEAKSSVEFRHNLRAQLWVLPPERWGTGLVYATGSKDHNVRLRELALNRGYSLNEKSFSRNDGSELLCATEEEVYAALGLPWIPPELREDRGEIEAARKGKLPHLIETGDIRFELHAHTRWSDGTLPVLELAQEALRRGFQVIGVTDHSPSLGITQGPSIEQLKDQRLEIEAAQRQLGDQILILQGTEVEIRADGSLDYPDEVLAGLDIVIASLHVSLRQPRAQVTERLLRAIRNPHVDMIGHPSGRIIPDREGADLDMDAVLSAAREAGVALEINASPYRLDLDEIYTRRAIEMGIPLSINTDAHSIADFDMLHFGVAAARRAWVEPQHVLSTWSREKLLDWLKKRS